MAVDGLVVWHGQINKFYVTVTLSRDVCRTWVCVSVAW